MIRPMRPSIWMKVQKTRDPKLVVYSIWQLLPRARVRKVPVWIHLVRKTPVDNKKWRHRISNQQQAHSLMKMTSWEWYNRMILCHLRLSRVQRLWQLKVWLQWWANRKLSLVKSSWSGLAKERQIPINNMEMVSYRQICFLAWEEPLEPKRKKRNSRYQKITIRITEMAFPAVKIKLRVAVCFPE